eukprot:TRINITY_DN4311_c0_g1_i1.p1 TRINITY_DN4311_c0_g1~~TRINITY_DN4311_c0_g1_i1.p1  ORF type:complete len:387 (+),score=62.15 TRINITY_DN4311_c0_g1_i1:204-1364(+)
MDSPSPSKRTAHKPNFGTATVQGKADVGEFADGYFIMPDTPKHQNNNNHYNSDGTPSKHRSKKDKRTTPPNDGQYTSPHPPKSPASRKKGLSVSTGRLETTSHTSTPRKASPQQSEIVCYDKNSPAVPHSQPIPISAPVSASHSYTVTSSSYSSSPFRSTPPGPAPIMGPSSHPTRDPAMPFARFDTSYVHNLAVPTDTTPAPIPSGLLTPGALKKLSKSTPGIQTTTMHRSLSVPEHMHESRGSSPSATNERWAGMTNAPPPRDLPLPMFSPEAPALSVVPPSGPSTPWETLLAAASMHSQASGRLPDHAPPSYYGTSPQPAHPGHPMQHAYAHPPFPGTHIHVTPTHASPAHFAPQPPQQTDGGQLGQLSTDLRKLLNINNHTN